MAMISKKYGLNMTSADYTSRRHSWRRDQNHKIKVSKWSINASEITIGLEFQSPLFMTFKKFRGKSF